MKNVLEILISTAQYAQEWTRPHWSSVVHYPHYKDEQIEARGLKDSNTYKIWSLTLAQDLLSFLSE